MTFIFAQKNFVGMEEVTPWNDQIMSRTFVIRPAYLTDLCHCFFSLQRKYEGKINTDQKLFWKLHLVSV